MKNFMYLFDEFLVWKTITSRPSEIEVHIYQDDEEIKKGDLHDFQNETYILHEKTSYVAEH